MCRLSIELESANGVGSKSFIAVLAFNATRNRGNGNIWPLKWKKRYRGSHVDTACVSSTDRPVSLEARITLEVLITRRACASARRRMFRGVFVNETVQMAPTKVSLKSALLLLEAYTLLTNKMHYTHLDKHRKEASWDWIHPCQERTRILHFSR